MIAQWYIALSEFSFTLEFIPGVENDILDAMSHLCRKNMIGSSQLENEMQLDNARNVDRNKGSARD